MNVITFAQLLLRRWWLVVGLVVVGAASAYTIQLQVPPQYQSTISLQLNPAAKSAFLPYLTDSGSNPVAAANSISLLAASYREVLRSRTFGEVVVQQLKLKVPPTAIAGAINTQLVPNTNILRLGVTWNNPSDAQQLTQRVAEIFISENLRAQQAEPSTQARLGELEQSARDIQARRAPLQQQRERLDQAVAHGDFSRLAELNGLDATLSSLETSYANLLVEMSRIRSSFDTAAILDRASPASPTETVSPMQAMLFGALAGLALGVGLAIVLEYLQDSVRSPRDVLGATGIPPLGRLRHAGIAGWRRSRQRSLVMLHNERSVAAEAFRSLRASMLLNAPYRPLEVLVVTSARPGEGKTFVASNLAIALAQAGQRVLLVDCDLRRPALHRVFGVSNVVGLVDLLRRSNRQAVGTPDLATQPVDATREFPGVLASSIDKLSILPAGTPPPNPAELLSSGGLGSLINDFKQAWDVVIFDTAPLGGSADALLLAQHASGSLVVARSGVTRRAALGGAMAALRGIGRPLVGVVLNDERPGLLSTFSRDDYYQHGYWSELPIKEPEDAVDAWPMGLTPAPAGRRIPEATLPPQERRD